MIKPALILLCLLAQTGSAIRPSCAQKREVGCRIHYPVGEGASEGLQFALHAGRR